MRRRTLVAAAVAASLCGSAAAATAGSGIPAHRLAGQRLVWSFDGPTPPPWLVRGIRRGDVGAVLLFSSNGTDPAAVRRLVGRLQAVRRPLLDPPLLIMSDHEGGPVRRLTAPPYRGAADLASLPVAASLAAGRQAGAALCRARINVDLAPVVDLARPGSVIASQGRSFGRGPDAVARRAGAFARGLAEHGVAAAPKHFPGLGAATRTTDDVPVRIGLGAATLRGEDMAPYRRLIAGGVPMVMVGTTRYAALAEAPAALSPEVVTGELRDALGFRGVVVADALDTPAPAGMGDGAVAEEAARAGVDLMPFVDPAAAGRAQRGLQRAIAAGRVSRDDARVSLERLLTFRRTLAISPPGAGAAAHRCRGR